MPLLARNKERKASILFAHVGVCVCVVVCALSICVCISASAFTMLDANLQVYVHVSVITEVQQNTFIQLRQLLIIKHVYNANAMLLVHTLK